MGPSNRIKFDKKLRICETQPSLLLGPTHAPDIGDTLRPNDANLQIQDLEDQVKFLKYNLELLAKKNLKDYEPQKKVWYEAFDSVRQQARSLTT